MGNATNINTLIFMSKILAEEGDYVDKNMSKHTKHSNSLEADDDSGSDPMGGGEDEGAGDSMDFDAGLDDLGGDFDFGDEGGGEGGDDSGGGDFSGGGMGGDSAYNTIDQEKKEVNLSPHYVQDRRIALIKVATKLLDSIKSSKEKLQDDSGLTSNKPIIEALSELEEDVIAIIDIINKEDGHDVSMVRISECRAIYNNIIEKV